MSEGADRAASSTAGDWIARADHVVVAKVIDEDRREPAQSELQRGEGLVMRDLRFRVDKVVWSSGRTARPSAPTEFDWLALGWLFKGDPDSGTTEMTGTHEPRFEVGHTYVMALEWESPECSADGVGRWRGLGSGALLPYDDARIGSGEFEGAETAVTEMRSEWSEHGATLAASLAGANSAQLAAALRNRASAAGVLGGNGSSC